MRSYGQRIKDLRAKANMSQGDLAKALKIAQPSLSDLEKSTYPPLNRIEQVCEIINIPVWQFFAPDDVVVPKVTEEQAEWNDLFDELPAELHSVVIDESRNVLKAYKLGKGDK